MMDDHLHSVAPVRRIRRACHPCRARKVKCNGLHPCQQCAHLGLQCFFAGTGQRSASREDPSRRKGIKRGSVIYSSMTQPATQEQQAADPTLSPGLSSQHGALVDAELLQRLSDGYMERVYPFYPVVDHSEVRACISSTAKDNESDAFVYALAAATIGWTSRSLMRDAEMRSRVETLAQLSLDRGGSPLDPKHPSVVSIMTPLLIHVSLASLQKREAAWYHLCQASTLVQLQARYDRSLSGPSSLDDHEKARRHRLYWMIFIHERFLAVRLCLPVKLGPLPALPMHDPALSPSVHCHFTLIARMFRLLDSTFFEYWLQNDDSEQTDAGPTISWIKRAQTELDSINLGDQMADLTNAQRSDVIITRQWLHMLFWQVAVRTCPLRSDARDVCLSLKFPLRLTRDLCWIIQTLSKDEIEVHGNSIVYKLFELTIAIIDVVSIMHRDDHGQHADVLADLNLLLTFVMGMERLDAVQQGFLSQKLQDLAAIHPGLQFS